MKKRAETIRCRTTRVRWDLNWTANYGGTDNPEPSARRNYIPIAFVPKQNPFYFALPYNDVTHGQFKPEAPLVSLGSSNPTPGRGSRSAVIAGLRFARATAFAMRNGGIAARFAQTIFNTSSETNGRNRILMMGPAWTFPPRCVNISG